MRVHMAAHEIILAIALAVWLPSMAFATAPTWSDRANALAEAQNWQGLLDISSQWTQAEPGNAQAWFSLGFAYGQPGRGREEIEAYKEALRLQPDFTEAWYNLATTYTISGNRNAALEAIRELRRYDPKEAEKLLNVLTPLIKP